MRLAKLVVALFTLLMLAPLSTNAQTRLTLGTSGGSSFGNLYLGVNGSIEQPIGTHFEFDASDQFSPLENHIALGSGWANSTHANGIGWVTKSIGLTGGAEYSGYKTSISKSAEYANGGIVIRHAYSGMPVRFFLGYIQEFNNGIDSTGTESSHLKAGDFALVMRVGCKGPVCFRTNFDFQVGIVKEQGNPMCDFSGGSCPRTIASSGTFSGGFSVEFPRHPKSE